MEPETTPFWAAEPTVTAVAPTTETFLPLMMETVPPKTFVASFNVITAGANRLPAVNSEAPVIASLPELVMSPAALLAIRLVAVVAPRLTELFWVTVNVPAVPPTAAAVTAGAAPKPPVATPNVALAPKVLRLTLPTMATLAATVVSSEYLANRVMPFAGTVPAGPTELRVRLPATLMTSVEAAPSATPPVAIGVTVAMPPTALSVVV